MSEKVLLFTRIHGNTITNTIVVKSPIL